MSFELDTKIASARFVTVEQHVEVGAELGRLQVDLEPGVGPVAGDGLDEFAVVQPAARRLADEGDRLAGDTGVLDELLGLVRIVRVRLERVVVAEDRGPATDR